LRQLFVLSRQSRRRFRRLPDVRGQAGCIEGLVQRVQQESLIGPEQTGNVVDDHRNAPRQTGRARFLSPLENGLSALYTRQGI